MKKWLINISIIALFLALSVSVVALGEEQKLVIWCNSVHQQVAEGTRGGAAIDVTADFEAEYNVKLEWVTIPWSQMQNKVLRELSAPKTDVNVVFLVQDWGTPTVLRTLEPLTSFMEKAPLEDFQDMPEGMVAPFTSEDTLKGVPYRSNPQILHYNIAIFEAKGITHAPTTFEELIEDARKTTYVRNDGAQVYGLGIKPSEDIISIVRAYGGDVLTDNYQVKCNEPATVDAIKALRDLYVEGVIPPNFTELASKDYQSLVSEGLVSMVFFGDNYYLRFNDPEKSKVAGDMWFSWIPAASGTGLDLAPAKIAFWAMAIPKNSPQGKRDLAWEFIRYFSSKDSQLKMALNGNGPIRASIFNDPQFAADVPYASVDQLVLKVASPLLPIFSSTQEVRDIFQEEATLAILGQKAPQTAMDAAAKDIEAVLERAGVK